MDFGHYRLLAPVSERSARRLSTYFQASTNSLTFSLSHCCTQRNRLLASWCRLSVCLSVCDKV